MIHGTNFDISKFYQSFLPKCPTLINLSDLVFLTATHEQDLSSSVSGVDFDKFFPSVSRVFMSHFARYPSTNDSDDSDDDDDERIMPAPTHSSSTVTMLELQLRSYRNTSFNQLKQAFPALKTLSVMSLFPGNMITLWQIFRLWPDLEEIKLKGGTPEGVWWNHDWEFCGVSRAEMEYLWEQDDEFLSKVQIVPIRPCLSTLQSKLLNFLLAVAQLGLYLLHIL